MAQALANELEDAGIAGPQRGEQVLVVAPEKGDVHVIVRPQLFQDGLGPLARLGDAAAAHRAGAVDDHLEAERLVVFALHRGNAQACEGDPFLPVVGDQERGGVCRPGSGREDEVAVEAGAAGQLHVEAGSIAPDADRVGRRAHFAVGQLAFDGDAQVERVLDEQVGLRRFPIFQPGIPGVAVAGCDGGRDEQAQAVAQPGQGHRIAIADDSRFARHQVAEVHRVQAVPAIRDHHGGVAIGDRLLVLPFGGLALDDLAGEGAAVDVDRQVEQHGADGQREGVDGFDVVIEGISDNAARPRRWPASR